MASPSSSSPHPAARSPTSPHHAPHSPFHQHLADADHCISPSQAAGPAAAAVGRARSGSRTYREVQEDEALERARTRSRERALAEDALEGRTSSAAAAKGAERAGEMSMSELRVEMETLLSLRRRSMSQPVAVDPDLPPTVPPTSPPPLPSPSSVPRPQLSLAIPSPGDGSDGASGRPPVSPTAPSPAETGTLVRRRSSVGGRLPSEHPLPTLPPVPSPTLQLPPSPFGPSSSFSPDTPLVSSSSSSSSGSAQAPSSDLFWLPASLHPELAPAEFKAFIRDQTRPEALARRSSLALPPGAAGRVGRRASLLRGEYKPRRDDGVGEERPEAREDEHGRVKRTTSDGGSHSRAGRRSRQTLNFEELTIRDLQRLEELAAKAEAEGNTEGEEEEGERLGRVLRRSLSLNPHRVAAAAAAAGANFGPSLSSTVEEPESVLHDPSGRPIDDEEAPIIVPPPGSILRRNARTKIRKTSIGGGIVEVGAGPASGGSGRYGPGARRSRGSTGANLGDLAASTSSSTLGGTTEEGVGASAEGASSAGDHSQESGESEEARAARAAAQQQQPRAPSTEEGVTPPSSDTQHTDAQIVDTLAPPLLSVSHAGSAPPSTAAPPAFEAPFPLDAQQPLAAPTSAPVAPTPLAIEEAPLPPIPPAQPPVQQIISPASAEYDWSTHHMPAVAPPPPPAPEPQYTVHPQHSPRQPFSDVPPPQAVPVPQPQAPASGGRRDSSASSVSSASSATSSRPESPKVGGKEKKSGWARLGLGGGGSDESKKKKGKGKEKEKEKDDGGSGASSGGAGAGDKGGKEAGGGFLGGLFGRRKNEQEPAPPRAPSPPPEPRIPPPPPTASGVLLPNGRYANFYRLPIHVERAVYRLSHIKLANPRRPLYEQVLISNLMFWYLGLIQKPAGPPPAAQPVPVPAPGPAVAGPSGQPPHPASPSHPPSAASEAQRQAPASKEPHKRVGLSKPSRGGRTAETPVRATSYEVQNQQLAEEQYQRNHHQQQYHAPYMPAPQQQQQQQPPPSSTPSKGLFAPPLSSTTVSPTPEPLQGRSPERTSAPAAMYPTRRVSGSSGGHSMSAEDDGDDDRPLGAQLQQQQQQYRESFPPNRPAQASGFEVTSRSPPTGAHRRLSSSGNGLVVDTSLLSSQSASSPGAAQHQRRASAVSDKSFDASEIYDAYAPNTPTSPKHAAFADLGPAPPGAGGGGPMLDKPPNALLGAVAPRGSSLKAWSGGRSGAPGAREYD